MALGTVIKTIRDFSSGVPVNLMLMLFPDGSTASLHGVLDTNGAPVDPVTDDGLKAVHTALQAIITKQTPTS